MRLQAAAIAVTLCALCAASCVREERSAPAAEEPAAPQPIEISECAEIQVFTSVESEPGTASEVVRFRAKPGAKLRMSRFALTHEIRATAGSTVGRNTASNDYVAEDIRDVAADRTETFANAGHVIHCLAEPTE